MSKRKGNIKYPRDLLETECIWNHIRFFFIYGHYRRKLNFAFKKYNKECKLLRSFRKMVKKLDTVEDSEQQYNPEAKKLVKKIKSDFQMHMNNDLNVKIAFDSMFETVSRLVKLAEQKKLSADDSKEVLAELKAIDYVLQTIF